MYVLLVIVITFILCVTKTVGDVYGEKAIGKSTGRKRSSVLDIRILLYDSLLPVRSTNFHEYNLNALLNVDLGQTS